jgi:acyl-CoA synthetase (AMP-forming)/AMP-acid ligase II
LAHAEARPEAPALATPTTRLSYGELAVRVSDLAGQFAAGGIGRGVRVLLALPNSPAAVVAALAVHSLGGTTLEVNRQWGPDTLSGIASRAGVRHAVISRHDLQAWENALARQPLQRVWVVGQHLLEDGSCAPALGKAPAPPATHRLCPDAPALILFTSGSTGRPRGVVQTFRNIDANTRSIVQYLGLSARDRALLVLPLFYCYGRSVLQTHLFAGGSVFLDDRFAFPRTVMEALGAENCTGFAGVPLTFEIMRRHVDVSTLSFPGLRYLTQAGGAMAPDTIAWVRKLFSPARLFVMYGQTEATSRLSYLPPERAADKPGSIGIPIPGVQLAVVDQAGRALPEGETGHLVARGDNVTPGYLDEPEETAAIVHDGWLWTGDLARRDADGFYFHRGRSKEILKIGGHRVDPAEIEQVLAAHPDVAEAAVIGEPDALKGQVPAGFIVLHRGRAVSAADIKKFCRERLPPYSVPATIRFLDALPRNPAGKLLRAALTADAVHV